MTTNANPRKPKSTLRTRLATGSAGLLLALAAGLAQAGDLIEENAKAQALFEAVFNEGVARSPEFQTYLGMKTQYDQWDDRSPAFEREGHALTQQQLARLRALDQAKLTEANALSYRLLEEQLQNELDDFRWRLHNYPINQMYGMHTGVPSLLINQHRIDNEADAEAYIARLKGVQALMAQVVAQLQERERAGIIAPKFVFPHVIAASENLLKGAPFDAGDDSPLLADFRTKVAALKLADVATGPLLARAESALRDGLKPGYLALIAELKRLEQKADHRDGAWKFPDGAAFYDNALARTTTTSLSADAIHAIGLREVARIHGEMRAIMAQVRFDGSLQAFFAFLRDDDRFYYPDTDAGRDRYLREASALIDDMKARLDTMFDVKPKADLLVKRVEPFRERSAGKAFYQQPAPDGSRPGIYYANLAHMKSMPTYQMAALAYHEGIPGHHMQRAIAQELTDIPMFRKFAGYTAYTEGWGLYTELLPKEMGLYQDPYADFGRLAMELWRACRLVVDTGIHAQKWTRSQAIDYLVANTPNSVQDGTKAIERYIVMPSQATAYKIGMLKILELRSQAQAQLGDRFDIRAFHDQLLKSGPLPLNLLEERIAAWIAQTRA